MSEKSTRIALGGVFSSLCLLLMFLTAVFPFSTFVMPMLAGAMLAVVVIENGCKTALLVYASVSTLSFFIVSDFTAKLMFIAFFGYYSALKPFLERIPNRTLEYAVKLVIFNATIGIGYLLSLKLFGLDELANDNEVFGVYMPLIMIVTLNFVFLIYDFSLTRYITVYINWFKPTFLRR